MGTAVSFFSVFLLLILSASTPTNQTPSRGISAPAAAPLSPNPSTSFIISNCATTTFPRLCRKKLSPYAAAVGTSAGLLAYAAVEEAIKRGSHSTAFITRVYWCGRPAAASSLSNSSTFETGLRLCAELLDDCLSQLRLTAREMSYIGLSFHSDGDSRWTGDYAERLGNAAGWAGDASNCFGICSDGFNSPVPSRPAALSSEAAATTAAPTDDAVIQREEPDPIATVVQKSADRAYDLAVIAGDLLYNLLPYKK